MDAYVDEFLSKVEPNFAELFANPAGPDDFELTYLPDDKKPLVDQENYARNVDSVAYITIEDEFGDVYTGAGTILTANGLILTNHHVLDGAQKVVVTTLEQGNFAVEQVIASDRLLDIAFIKIDAQDLTPLAIGDSDSVAVGDKTLVIGHPESFLHSLSLGNVGGLRTYETSDRPQLQITNPISEGSSGGAVLNEYGELIGIPTWFLDYEDNIVQVQNLNFAIPINEAVAMLRGEEVEESEILK
ncbi:MAG: trypsin-like peptidase domain-containing protein [Patescibacteria group bacterium]